MKMIRVRTDILSELALDWAVAVADQKDPKIYVVSATELEVTVDGRTFNPSSDWAKGGLLRDKYQVDLLHSDRVGISCRIASKPDWKSVGGRTALIAICRAIVLHTIGEIVTVPTDLMPGAPSIQQVEQMAAVLIAQAHELRACGPAEWSSFNDMVEGALNNIRVDMGGLRD
ncbi:phage protein NinX family protein [Aeromonas caviae]|uniref:phage protein NinX family protein n=1 Tax=Aeromonas caviae TaxID=648 RepID=UPI0025B700F9|nr:phage protein NinX family protein [Aeromonas caviae]